ncbi:DUF5916 domain-containing protein [Bacteroidota bacterium]
MIRKFFSRAGCFTFLICLISNTAISQQIPEKHIIALKVDNAIQIDGQLNEAIWNSKSYSGFIQTDPDDGSRPTEKTEVWIAYDNKNLYIAARLYDSEPDKIVSRLGRRDDLVDSDWFTIAIDPYNDKRSGYQFSVNPAGSIADYTLFNDEENDNTWDGVWESSAKIDEKGWIVEISIPFYQLRFKKRETYTWGINFSRTIKRKNEQTVFSWVPKEESGYVSKFAILSGIKNINPGVYIEFLPYIMASADIEPEVPGNPFKTGKEYNGNVGFDLKTGLKSNLTLNATFNPDFGQVEVDPAVINISDQETYYSEKRPFFIEGADIFRFGGGGANISRNLGWRNPGFFYSRRIGRSPQGYVSTNGYADYPQWTKIIGAAKLSGKIGNGWNIGVMNALTGREFATIDINGERSEQEVEPFSNYGVIRVLKEFNKGRQGIGVLATSVLRDIQSSDIEARISSNAESYAFDAWTFLDKENKWVITGWLGGTKVSGSKEAITGIQKSSLHYFQRPDIDYVSVDENATQLNGWAGRLFLNKQKGNIVFNSSVGAISPGFNAMDMGYHSRGDKINAHIETGYQSFHPGKIMRNWKTTIASSRIYSFGGRKIHEYYYFNSSAQFLNYWQLGLTLSYDPNRYNSDITRGGPMTLYPWGFSKGLKINTDNRKDLVFGLSLHHRTHPYGAYNYSFNGSVQWKPSSNLSLKISPGYSWRHSVGQWVAAVEDKNKTETYGVRYVMSDIIQETIPIEIRLNWTFSPKLSLQTYIQPYIAVGDYFRFKELDKPMTWDFHHFGEDDNSTISLENNYYTVDPDGTGPSPEFSFRDPDINMKSLRGNLVLRWEYKPGSTFFLVWTQSRSDYSSYEELNFGDGINDMFSAPAYNIFLLKFNYRFKI